jgi:hypothetical protein
MIARGLATSTLQTEFLSSVEDFYIFIISSIVALIVRFWLNNSDLYIKYKYFLFYAFV